MSQADLARKLACPQPTVSRLETGQHSVTLRELLSLSQALNEPVSDLLAQWEKGFDSPERQTAKAAPQELREPAGFYEVPVTEEAVMAQLAAHGVRFMGSPVRPTAFKLRLEETLLAALRYAHDPRVFEALPSLVLRYAQGLDWRSLLSAVLLSQLQNRLGMVVAAALQMKKSASDIPKETWDTLEEVHDRLSQARLDREEVLGPKPKTNEAREFLRSRTPSWMRAWRGVGSVDLGSMRRYLSR